MSVSVQRLIDEADIRDLILRFSQALDAKDWDAYADTFATDAEFVIMGQRRTGRAAIASGPRRDLERYDALQHFVTNPHVELAGDVARGGWYAIGVHVPKREAPTEHADVGVRYRFVASRATGGWRFLEVVLEPVWAGGIAFQIEGDPAPPS